jgi:sensor histidine kinase YesM
MNILKDFLLQLALVSTLIYTYQIFFALKSERSGYEKLNLSILFGLAVLLCMYFPVYFSSDYHVDIRVIPLLLGALYGGWETGIFLTVLIVGFRIFKGIDLGFYTTTLTLLFSMPVILYARRFFIRSHRAMRVVISLALLVFYSFTGLTTETIVRGETYAEAFRIHALHTVVSITALLFFVLMNETVRRIIRINQQLQTEAKDAEIAFLRSQIKPHFLYNALNSIAALCVDEPGKAEQLILDLSKYLRSSFDFKQLKSFTTVGEELELVQAYINIEQARFGARLNVEYDIDPGLNPDLPIPPLVLQPLVENAIRHGLMSNIKGGTVRISVHQGEGGSIRFAVEDDGCGMNEASREEILKPEGSRKGIGLWNINQRFGFYYGNGLQVESSKGIGTKVVFTIPDGLKEGIGLAAGNHRGR